MSTTPKKKTVDVIVVDLYREGNKSEKFKPFL